MNSNTAALERFRQEVLVDPSLQRQLQDTKTTGQFVELFLRLARERGYAITELEIDEALRDARRTWIERWID